MEDPFRLGEFDRQREARIMALSARLKIEFYTNADRKFVKQLWSELRDEILKRSPAQVEALERERGLWRHKLADGRAK